MAFLLLLPCVLSFWLLGAHYLFHAQRPFDSNYMLMALACLTPLVLLIRRRPILWGVQVLLMMACLEWLSTAWEGAQQHQLEHRPVVRYLVIMGSVAVFNLLAAVFLAMPRVKKLYPLG